MFLSVYTLKSLISIGIVITLFLGIILLYVLVYAFLVSSVTAQILPDFRNGFIATFMATSILMMLSSLSGIYGLIRKQNKFVIIYSVTMLFYFIVFIVMAAFLVQYPNTLQGQCQNTNPAVSDIRVAVIQANSTLCKSCECYFNNMNEYNLEQQHQLEQMGFVNYTDINQNDTYPVNAQNCQSWSNTTYIATNSLVFLQSVFNCSGWCQVPPEQNLYYLFTSVNRGIPKYSCIVSLLKFFNHFGKIMLISCICISSVLFLILLSILCLCCHPDRGNEYDALKFFKSTLMVQLNQQSNVRGFTNRDTLQ